MNSQSWAPPGVSNLFYCPIILSLTTAHITLPRLCPEDIADSLNNKCLAAKFTFDQSADSDIIAHRILQM